MCKLSSSKKVSKTTFLAGKNFLVQKHTKFVNEIIDISRKNLNFKSENSRKKI